jgi:hypothetical protein
MSENGKKALDIGSELNYLIGVGLKTESLGRHQGPSDGNDGTYGHPPVSFDTSVWELGWTDGRLNHGTPQSQAYFRALGEWVDRREQANSRKILNQIATEVGALEVSEHEASNELAEASVNFKEVAELRRQRPSQFSFVGGTINIVVALLLLLADIPLSLLVAAGFGVKIQDPEQNIKFDMLFYDFPVFIKTFWEAALLCAGIAVLGLFFKILAEDLLDEALKGGWREWLVRGLNWLTGAVMIATIFYLGKFRFDIMLLERQGSSDDYLEKLQRYGLPSFVLLTMILPAIGGISFAIGMRKISNIGRYRELKRLRGELLARISNIRSRKEELSGERAALGDGASGNERQRSIGAILYDIWENMYKHGYERGNNVPQTVAAGSSLYGRCETILQKILSRKSCHL